MDFPFALSPFRRSTPARTHSLRAVLASCSLLLAVGCSEAGGGDEPDATTPGLPGADGGSTYVPPTTTPSYDAGAVPNTGYDAGSFTGYDAGKPTTTYDAGSTNSGTGSDAGSTNSGTGSKDAGGITFPDLGGLLGGSDAGTSTPKPDASVPSGTRDPNGPCKDLNLLCFDGFDMFIINPSDCFTCNGGKGCQACILPFAI